MKVLVGECTGGYVPELQRLGWGRMWIARGRNIYTYPGEPWGFDNGAFRDWKNKMPFDGDLFLLCLDKALAIVELPYLAVLPDIPAGGKDSLALSVEWLERLPEFPWYLAVQDGLDPVDIPDLPISGIFLGGTDSYKARALEWKDWAHDRGLRFHYGRCGTPGKVVHAQEIGADSIDSAVPMWTRARFDFFVRIITRGHPQNELLLTESD